jgi:hypothetical protein
MQDILKSSRIGEAQSIRRAIAAKAIAIRQRSTPEKILRQNWPRDEGAATILRSAVTPTKLGDYPSTDVIVTLRSLAPGSAALKLFTKSVQIDLKGVNTVRIPNLAALPVKPVFVAEGAPAPAVQFTTAASTLGPVKKILVLSGVSHELFDASAETAANVVGRILADASNAAIDKTAFDANPADAARPAGLLNGVAPIPPAAAGNGAMIEDLSNLVSAMGSQGVDPSDAVFVASPKQAMTIMLSSGPNFQNSVLMSLGLPAKTVCAFAPAGAYSGSQDAPVIETAEELAIHREDTSPQEIVSTGGVPAVPTSGFFQQDIIAIRVRAWCSWAVAPGAAQFVQNVNW